MTDLTVGKRLRSTLCDTEVIVVRAPDNMVELSCGGHPMTAHDAVASSTAAPVGADPATVLGKRYVDSETGLEVLCTKSGPSQLTADGRPLPIKAPKALPASD
jgi:hypothetical protein